jgi:AraC-like DNA-binding protein
MTIALQAALPSSFAGGTYVEVERAQRALIWCAGKDLTVEADGESVSLPSALVALLPAGQRLTLAAGGHDGVYAVVEFDDLILLDALSYINMETTRSLPVRAALVFCEPETSVLFLLVCRAIVGETITAKPLFFALLAQLLAQTADAEPACSHQHELVESVKRIVARGYADKLTLENTARDLYVNASYLSTLFKRKTGMSFRQFLCHYRIEKAQDLLLNTSEMVEDVATATGFGSTAYFISVFREHCGVTPNVYRTQARRQRFHKRI